VKSMLTTERTVLLEFHPVRILTLILRCRIVSVLTVFASQCDDISHDVILLDDLSNHASTDGSSAFTNSKAKTLLHCDRSDQFTGDRYTVTGDNHFHAFRQ